MWLRGGVTIQQYKIGICDEDESYMISLMSHINSDRDNPLFALAFSGGRELIQYLEAGNLDVILIGENVYREIGMVLRGRRCMIFTPDRERRIAETGVGIIFKYSRVKDIVSDILAFMNVVDVGRSRDLFRSYAVMSPVGRCGKTSLAVSLCMNDEVRGGLYIGMEEYGGFQDKEDVISNIIYLARERSSDLMEYMESHVANLENYSVLGYLRSYIDAMELERDDMAWLVDQIRMWGRYTTVVFDVGPAVFKDITIWGTFDEVIVPTLGDEFSDEKIGAFESLLDRSELGKIARRLQIVSVPDAPPGSAEMLRFIQNEMGAHR